MTREFVLPEWARVSEKRLAHILRVTSLLDDWAAAMQLDASEAAKWHDAGCLHDALRDASEDVLRSLARDAARSCRGGATRVPW
jgi:HD superfamily phosphohydrolase YqeK